MGIDLLRNRSESIPMGTYSRKYKFAATLVTLIFMSTVLRGAIYHRKRLNTAKLKKRQNIIQQIKNIVAKVPVRDRFWIYLQNRIYFKRIRSRSTENLTGSV